VAGRLNGFIGLSVWYSAYLAAVIPIVLCGIGMIRHRAMFAVVLVGLVLGAWNLWWTGTRTALAVFGPSILIAIWFTVESRRWRGYALGAAVAVAAAGCLLWPGNLKRIALAVSRPPKADWIERRMAMWRPTWQLIKNRPLRGYGYDVHILDPDDVAHYGEKDYVSPGGARWIHNNALQLWKESGLFSLVAYAGFVVAQMWLFLRLAARRTHRALAVGLLLSAVALVVTGLTENTFTDRIGRLLWMITGFGIGMAYSLLDAPPSEAASHD